jgi:hypothetical protein
MHSNHIQDNGVKTYPFALKYRARLCMLQIPEKINFIIASILENKFYSV